MGVKWIECALGRRKDLGRVANFAACWLESLSIMVFAGCSVLVNLRSLSFVLWLERWGCEPKYK